VQHFLLSIFFLFSSLRRPIQANHRTNVRVLTYLAHWGEKRKMLLGKWDENLGSLRSTQPDSTLEERRQNKTELRLSRAVQTITEILEKEEVNYTNY
jgi:hypothetical protein